MTAPLEPDELPESSLESSLEPDELPEFEPDFAEEHRDMTVGDGDRGGPEHAPEQESPRGYGGADFHRSVFRQL